MSLNNEILRVVEYIDRTGKTTKVALRELWLELKFSEPEATQLQQDGFGALVSEALVSHRKREILIQSVTTVSRPDLTEARPAPMPVSAFVPVSVKVTKAEPKTVSVSVRVLEETMYDIHGAARKAIADFELSDCSYVIERNKAAIRGQQRHLVLFQYIYKKLEATGTSQVRELPDDEKVKIVNMLLLAKRGEGPLEPLDPDNAGVMPRIGPVGQGAVAVAEVG